MNNPHYIPEINAWHEPVTRHTLKRWKQEWKMEQFRNRPVHIAAGSLWLLVVPMFSNIAYAEYA